MNNKRIIFSGIVTAIVGVGLGLVILQLAPTPYTGEMYQNLNRKYSLIGGIAGLLFGASQEAVRQLKRQCDQEEALTAQREQSK